MTAHINQTSQTISVTTTSASAAYPPGNTRGVFVYNNGTTPVFVNSGNSSVVATTSNTFVPAGGTRLFEKPANDTFLAAIAATGTATVYFTLQSTQE